MVEFIQGKYSVKNIAKYKGDPTKVFFRSSWEYHLMKEFDENPHILEWSSEEIIIPYLDPTSNNFDVRRYFPDFYIKFRDRNDNMKTMLLEVKPYKQTMIPEKPKKRSAKYTNEVKTYAKNSAKWKAAEKFCQKNGWEFKLITEKEIGLWH